MENLLMKLTICAGLFFGGLAVLKIGGFYLLHRLVKQKAYENYTKKQLKELKKKKEQQRIKQQLELEDILKKGELQVYYTQARDLFHDAIQARNLDREQILYLKKVINEALGDYINDFRYTRFKNDAHEIYTKIKSSHISIPDFKKIIQLIKVFEAQNAGQFLTIVEEEAKERM